MEDTSMENAKKNGGKKKLVFILILIILVAVIAAVYMKSRLTPNQRAEKENKETIESVRKLMIIPEEQPVIATINQADVLVKEQPFYNGSQNGDRLVIFPKNQKAIIYSPKRNIIVNSGPFVISSGQNNPPAVAPEQ